MNARAREIAEAQAQRRLGMAVAALLRALTERQSRAAESRDDVKVEEGSFGEYADVHLESWEPTFPLDMLDSTREIMRKLHATAQAPDGGACVLFFMDERSEPVSAIVTLYSLRSG